MTKKAISFAEFNEFPLPMQLDILQKDGVHIGKRFVEGRAIMLFQLYSFYVEISYKEYRKEIEQIITSSHLDILQPYLDQIQVKGLDHPSA